MTLTAAAALAAMERLPLVTFEQLAARSLVVIAPHPDDESLGCGGLIAAARSRALPVQVVVVSDGTGSHPNSRSYPPDRLRTLREKETFAAMGELGLPREAVTFLRLPDRLVPSDGPRAEAAVAAILSIADAGETDLLTATWGHDPHHDHQAVFQLALRVCHCRPRLRLLTYSIWGHALPPDEVLGGDPPRGVRLSIEKELVRKRRAIAAHRSQLGGLIEDDPDGFRLSAAELARFHRPFEIFVEAWP